MLCKVLPTKQQKWYTQEQWFDNYYPKSFGKWRKNYNLSLFLSTNLTGCTILDYCQNYEAVCNGDDTQTQFKIRRVKSKVCIESIFIKVGSLLGDSLQCYRQPKDNSLWLNVQLRKNVRPKLLIPIRSHSIMVSGNDDISYIRYFDSFQDANEKLTQFKNHGIEDLMEDTLFCAW